MGFRQGAYARVWSVNNEGKYSTANVSVSKKNKETGKYDVEFSNNYVRLVGTAHEDAQKLNLPTREQFNVDSDKGVVIKISSCDVTSNYDQKSKKIYTNFAIFGFEIPDENGNSSTAKRSRETNKTSTNSHQRKDVVYDEDNELPF